jgi:hypothetical protein
VLEEELPESLQQAAVISGSAHETEKIVRLGLPRIIRLKENAPELDFSSFYGKTGTGRPTAL